MPNRDTGEAKVIVELRDGYIFLFHGTEGHRIIRREAYEGDWLNLILAIMGLTESEVLSMRRGNTSRIGRT